MGKVWQPGPSIKRITFHMKHINCIAWISNSRFWFWNLLFLVLLNLFVFVDLKFCISTDAAFQRYMDQKDKRRSENALLDLNFSQKTQHCWASITTSCQELCKDSSKVNPGGEAILRSDLKVVAPERIHLQTIPTQADRSPATVKSAAL